MKRENHLYEKMISDDNLKRALLEVNKSHRWNPGHRPNRTVQDVEADIPGHVRELREILEQGFVPKPVKRRRRYDHSAGKWRDICELALWPDQYVHHVLVQTLEPVMMRGMDRWCCGSIKQRGTDYGRKAMQKWMRSDQKGTRYCMELDIHHFYDSLQPRFVIDRLKEIIKDRRVLDLAERITAGGIQIGAYSSQWFANTTLQPLDCLIRRSGLAKHYCRYMDNFTILGGNRRKLKKLFRTIKTWLNAHGLEIKDNWQIYPTDKRMPSAMGFRYAKDHTLLRKRNLLRITRQIGNFFRKCRKHRRVLAKFASGLLSRLGQVQHCNHTQFYQYHVPKGIQKTLKSIIRKQNRKDDEQWNRSTFSERCASPAQ